MSGTDAAPDEEAAALLFGRARAQSATVEKARIDEAFASLSRAFDYYVEVGDVALVVAAAEFPIANPGIRLAGLAQILARALSLVPADSHDYARLLARYGGILGISEVDYEGAQEALERAMVIARREGDLPLETLILANTAAMNGQHLHWQESVDHGAKAIELAPGEEASWPALGPQWWTLMGFLNLGDLEAARPHSALIQALAERRRTHRMLASNSFGLITNMSCLEGDWKKGRKHSDRGLELEPLQIVSLTARVLLKYETGESQQGEIYLERMFEAMNRAGPIEMAASVRVPLVIATISRTTGISDRLEMAESTAEATILRLSVTPLYARDLNAALALIAVQRGDHSTAEEPHAYLLGHRGTMIWTISSIDRILGLLS